MSATVMRAVVLVIALIAAWKVNGKEARLRFRQRRWSDVAATAMVFFIVSLFTMVALLMILHTTAAMQCLEQRPG